MSRGSANRRAGVSLRVDVSWPARTMAPAPEAKHAPPRIDADPAGNCSSHPIQTRRRVETPSYETPEPAASSEIPGAREPLLDDRLLLGRILERLRLVRRGDGGRGAVEPRRGGHAR